jgi:replicative DNA helicase
MGDVARDENERLTAGTLPANPGDDAVPIPVESQARKIAVKLAATETKGTQDPSDVTAETALLAALVWCGTYAVGSHTPSTVGDLLDRDDMFFVQAHRAIWRAMVSLRGRGAPCDATAVHSELVRERKERVAGGMEYLERLLADAAPATDLKLREYAESIREAWLRRQLIETGREIAAEARAGKTTASGIASSHAAKLAAAASKGARDASFVHVSATVASTLDKAQAPADHSALTTGFPKLDRLLLGGLRRKQVTILGARTSVGKSAVALDMVFSAHRASPSESVMYVSMEMAPEEFSDRMISARSNVELEKILLGSVTDEEFERMRAVAADVARQDIYFNVRQSLTIEQIRGMATKVAHASVTKGKRLGIVVIDHIGLVKPEKKLPSREQEVAATSRSLRDIANEFDCHVLALAQIAREAEKQTGKDKMPQLHHLRESGSIEQDTNNVLILHRDRAKDGRGFVEGRPARLAVAKARNAKLGLVWLAVEPNFVRFSPWETSEQNKARAPDPHRNPSRQYIDDQPDPEDT